MPSPSQDSPPSTHPNQDPILPSPLLHDHTSPLIHDDRSIEAKLTIISEASTPSATNRLTSCVSNNEPHIEESNTNVSLDVGIPPTPTSSQVLPTSP